MAFQRHRSRIETLGILFALSLAYATMRASIESTWTFFLAPLPVAWAEFSETWRMAIVGGAIVILLLAPLPSTLPERRMLRWPVLALAIGIAAALGYWAQEGLVLLSTGQHLPANEWPMVLHESAVLALAVGALGEYRWRSLRAATVLHEAGLNRIRVQAELAAGRLLVLQAQIEPHFLFNSLANVRRLLRIDGTAGREMLADLMRYLEIALPRMREDRSTLAREAELARAFLAVHQVRMGSRLHFRIDVPVELGALLVPPMMLLTLIENALKHGLAPLPEGGSIDVRAFEADGRLLLNVVDTGRGFVAKIGGGTGLANIRSRLKAMYGAAAVLSLRLNEPRGVVAEIELPVQSA